MQTRWIFVGVMFCGAVLGGVSACRRGEQAGAASRPAPLVTVARPRVQDVTVWDEYTGRLEAKESVNVNARVSGYILNAPFTEGALVKEGDLLFQIDPAPFQAQLNSALGAVRQVEAKVQLAKADLARAEKAGTSAISPEELDTRRGTLRQAEGELATAQANAEAAQLNVTYTKVVAPISGRIGRKLVTPGNLIVGGAGGTVTLLTTIASVDPVYCYIDVDEGAILKYQAQIREKKRVSAREQPLACWMALANERDFNHPGFIDFVDNRVDASTGTLRVRGVFPNPGGYLTPGMFGRFRVKGEEVTGGILVSAAAIATDQNRRNVLVVGDDGKVQYRPVTLGPAWEDMRVVTEGLKSTDRVIVNGQMMARPGMTVRTMDAEMPTATTRPGWKASSMPAGAESGVKAATQRGVAQATTEPATQAGVPANGGTGK